MHDYSVQLWLIVILLAIIAWRTTYWRSIAWNLKVIAEILSKMKRQIPPPRRDR